MVLARDRRSNNYCLGQTHTLVVVPSSVERKKKTTSSTAPTFQETLKEKGEMVTTNSTRLFLALIAALLLFFLCVVSWNGQDLKQQSAVEAADVQENLRVSAAATDVEESQKHRRTLDFISLLPLLGRKSICLTIVYAST